ncbi:MAG TPA: hypothetical protein VFT14_05325 [Solirubrobacterales bacterium]|nr:hypothetical protein [Solirubrobacterales bacterium]
MKSPNPALCQLLTPPVYRDPITTRERILTVLLGITGIVAAGAITLAANSVSGREIGLSAQPVSLAATQATPKPAPAAEAEDREDDRGSDDELLGASDDSDSESGSSSGSGDDGPSSSGSGGDRDDDGDHRRGVRSGSSDSSGSGSGSGTTTSDADDVPEERSGDDGGHSGKD